MKTLLVGLVVFTVLCGNVFSKVVTLADGNCSCTVPDGWSELANKSGEIMVRDDATGRICNLKIVPLPSAVSVKDPGWADGYNGKLKDDGFSINSTGTFQFKGHEAFQTDASNTVGKKMVSLYSITIIIGTKLYVVTIINASGEAQKDADLSAFINSVTLPES